MANQKTNGKTRRGPDAETRALNNSPDFQELMAQSDRSIRERRTRPAEEVFRRQQARRARITAG